MKTFHVIRKGAFDSNAQCWHEDEIIGTVRAMTIQSAKRQAYRLAGTSWMIAVREPDFQRID